MSKKIEIYLIFPLVYIYYISANSAWYYPFVFLSRIISTLCLCWLRINLMFLPFSFRHSLFFWPLFSVWHDFHFAVGFFSGGFLFTVVILCRGFRFVVIFDFHLFYYVVIFLLRLSIYRNFAIRRGFQFTAVLNPLSLWNLLIIISSQFFTYIIRGGVRVKLGKF